MRSAIIVFPGSNRDRDMAMALEQASGQKPSMIWHKETEIPDVDLIVVPGGFSYGDYLRAGAMGALSPAMTTVKERAAKGCLSSASATGSRPSPRRACCQARLCAMPS